MQSGCACVRVCVYVCVCAHARSGVGRGGGSCVLASLDLIGARSSGDIVASLSQVQLAAVGQSLVALHTRVLQAIDATLHRTQCLSA